MNPTQIAVLPDGKPIVGTISGDKILGTEQTFRVQAEAEAIPLILVSRTLIIGEYDDDMAVDISAGAERAGYQVCAVNASAAGLLTIGLGGDASLELQPSTSQLFSWTGSEWQADFSLTTGGSDNEEKFLRWGENGPEWYSATPIGPSTADDLPDGEAKGITLLAGKTAADDIGAATGSTTALKLANLTENATTTQEGVVLLGSPSGAAKITEAPDSATPDILITDGEFAATTGYTASNATLTAEGGRLCMVPTTRTCTITRASTPAFTSKMVQFRFKKDSKIVDFQLYNGTSYVSLSRVADIDGLAVFESTSFSKTGTTMLFKLETNAEAGVDKFELAYIFIGSASTLPGSILSGGIALANSVFMAQTPAAKAAIVGGIPTTTSPEGASNTYIANFATADGWKRNGTDYAGITCEDGVLSFAHTNGNYLRRIMTVESGKYIYIKFMVTGTPYKPYLSMLGANEKIPFVVGEWTYARLTSATNTQLALYAGTTYSEASEYTIKLAGLTYGDMSLLGTKIIDNGIKFLDEMAIEYADAKAAVLPALSLRLPPIYAVVGRECNIYFDNLFSGRYQDWDWDVSCAVGTQQNERWTWIPDAASSNAITISAYDPKTGRLAGSVTTTATAVAADAGTGTPKVLVIGDSTTAGGTVTEELSTLMTADTAMDITLVGTQGTAPNLHEGHSGWKISSFVTTGSPFYIGGVVDFTAYQAANPEAVPGCDIAVINLGINDAAVADLSVIDMDIAAATCKTQLDTLIASMQTYNASMKIGIALTTPPSANQDAFGTDYGSALNRAKYKRNLDRYWSMVMTAYAGRTAELLWVVPINTCLDTVHNMQLGSEAPWNSRTTEVTTRQDNGVHPAAIGYYQVADALYAWIKAIG